MLLSIVSLPQVEKIHNELSLLEAARIVAISPAAIVLKVWRGNAPKEMKLQFGAGDAIVAGGGSGEVRGVGAVHEILEAVAHGAALVELGQDGIHHLLGGLVGVPLTFRGLAGIEDGLELALRAVAIVVELADLGVMGGAGEFADLGLLGRSGGGENEREQGEQNETGENCQNAHEVTSQLHLSSPLLKFLVNDYPHSGAA